MWEIEADENEHEIKELLADQQQWAVFLATTEDNRAIGFLEVRLRDCADGATSSPVGYLEGWYVEDEYRNQGIGRQLVQAGEDWSMKTYREALGTNLPIEIRSLIERQYEQVQQSHSRIKTLRDAHAPEPAKPTTPAL